MPLNSFCYLQYSLNPIQHKNAPCYILPKHNTDFFSLSKTWICIDLSQTLVCFPGRNKSINIFGKRNQRKSGMWLSIGYHHLLWICDIMTDCSLGYYLPKRKLLWLTASSTGHFCNEDIFSRCLETKCMQWVLLHMSVPLYKRFCKQTRKSMSLV